jgi:ABC-type lipoprotein export system ATPase subunit
MMEDEMVGTDGKAFVRLEHVHKSYRTAAGETPVLREVNLEIPAGEFVGVVGKSGSGKSTLLNMITGVDRPTSGEIWVGGTPVHELSEGQMAVWRGKHLGIVFQFFQLLPMLSLAENVMLPMDFCGMYEPAERSPRAMHLLEMVEMADHADKLPSALSGGQQQRVAIARALANDPSLLVADEPTGNLDSKTAEAVFALFHDMVDRGKTVIMVTHDGSLARRVKRTILLADGEIVNEYVARALPTLSLEQMAHATRHLTAQTVAPGTAIMHQGETEDRFYIVTKGKVQVVLHRPRGSDVVVSEMTPGQYFGEIEVLRGGTTAATVRAADTAMVELVSLDRQTMVDLLAQSEATRDAVERIVEQRLAENLAAREGQA